MKLKYILSSIIAAASMFVACNRLEPVETLDNITVSSDYFTLKSDEGAGFQFVVNGASDWSVDQASVADWLSIDPMSGKAGQDVTVKVTAKEENKSKARKCEVKIKVGDSVKLITVNQAAAEGVIPAPSTCQEVNDGDDDVTYMVTGTIKQIVNTHYGNWYITDDTGVVYIYGTRDKAGATNSSSTSYDNINDPNYKNSWMLEVGDEVTISGPKTTFNGTPELKDVTIMSVVKSLVKVESIEPVVVSEEGGNVEMKVVAKGESLDITADTDWMFVSDLRKGEADTTVVTLAVLPNEGGNRVGTVTFASAKDGQKSVVSAEVTQLGAIKEVSCAEFNLAEDGTALYRISGIVTNVADDTYGNIYVKDATGEVYIYGTLDKDGKAQNFKSLGVEVGDIITVVGPKSTYNGAPQMKNGQYESHKDVKAATAAEVNAMEDDDKSDPKNYVLVTGKVTKPAGGQDLDLETYGNFDLVDETGDIFVYGVSTGWNGETKKFGTLGVKEGDIITLIGYKTSYKGTNELVAMYVSHETPEEEVKPVDISCADFNKAEDGDTQYRISGIVTKITNDKYGNIYVKDATGEVYIYGTLDKDGKTQNFKSLDIQVGDIITLVGTKSSYNGSAQMKNGQYESHKDVKAATAAEVNAMEDDDKNDPKNYVLVTGKVTKPTANGRKFDLKTYGNFDLVDETGDLYVYGVSTGWNGETKKFETLGVKEGDIITLVGYKTSYNGTNELVAMYLSHETPEEDPAE